MKLVAIAKYLSIRNSIKPFIYIAVFSFCLTSQAQKYRTSFDNVSLAEAVLSIAKQYDIKVAFDAQKLENKTVKREVAGNTAAELIDNLFANTGFYAEYKYGQFLIVEKTTAPITVSSMCEIIGSVSDNETG